MAIKSYKGMDKNMQCLGFQYKSGETYETDEAEICSSGFHACEAPLDVFGYYPPGISRFFEVEQDGKISRGGVDSKISSTKISIGAESGIPGLVKAHIDLVKSRTTTEHTDPERATAGACGAATAGESGAATAGACGAATAGDYGAATARGSVSVGKDGCGLVRGENIKARGGLGSILIICIEEEDSYNIKEWKASIVDGKIIKPDTWYTLKDGEFVEAEE